MQAVVGVVVSVVVVVLVLAVVIVVVIVIMVMYAPRFSCNEQYNVIYCYRFPHQSVIFVGPFPNTKVYKIYWISLIPSLRYQMKICRAFLVILLNSQEME